MSGFAPRRAFVLVLSGLLTLGALSAAAQTGPVPPPAQPAPTAAPPAAPAPPTARLSLQALFSDKGARIPSGVRWRVFRITSDAASPTVLAGISDDPAPTLALEPGRYVIHASYGLAAATTPVTLGEGRQEETLALDCGALRIAGAIGDKPLAPDMLTARVFALLPTGERRLVAQDVPATDPIRLPAGRYFVESTYGASNASVSAEIAVKAGQMTQATFHHAAATLTLKLVNTPGGEALADTAWSVLTPGGDTIRESIGAFPSMILAEGNYVIVAKHDGRVYTREFDVKAGLDQDIEVMAQ